MREKTFPIKLMMIIGCEEKLDIFPEYLEKIYNDSKNKVLIEIRGDQCCAILI